MNRLLLAVAGLAFAGLTQAGELSVAHGFYRVNPVSKVPVAVCPYGFFPEKEPAGLPCRENKVLGAKHVDSLSPEAYVQIRCPGAKMTSLTINSWGMQSVIDIGFDLPASGCPKETQ